MEVKKAETEVAKLDKNMSIEKAETAELKWMSPMEPPFRLAGFAWIGEDKVYRRLPSKPMWSIPESVDLLSNRTAGGQICFRTDSRRLLLRVKLGHPADMYHMPATGQCGFDCYLGEPGNLTFCGVSRYDHTKSEYECIMYEVKERELRNVVLNFPLYREVEEVMVGVDEQAEVLEPLPYKTDRRAIFYGTSITQGGCASRPGMAYTNIISRKLNVECINLGFSGNGRGEPELARIITQIERPGCIVLDYEANCFSRELFHKTLPEFIEILRSVHKEIPILVVSKIKYGKEVIDDELLKTRLDLKEFQFNLVEELKRKGDRFIYFYDGEKLLGDSFDECTVDGVHPTDLGFMRMAEKLTPVIEKILL